MHGEVIEHLAHQAASACGSRESMQKFAVRDAMVAVNTPPPDSPTYVLARTPQLTDHAAPQIHQERPRI
jgi:hypothetical protein